MVFADENEAYNTYNAYAICKGFGVQKRQKTNNSKGVLRRCTFVYGVWEVTKFKDVHNHYFIDDKQKHLIQSYRHITDTNKGILTSMTGAGIRAIKAYSYLCDEAGGSNNIGFTLRDCQNFLQTKRRNLICAGQRLTNVFWSNGVSKLDYESFGDVVVFDTTYWTNKYNMICAPLVGLNHHWKNFLFGCAFLMDETIGSFVWAFRSFLEVMGNKAPKTIFTDQDHAMANAIRTVFLNFDHRLCIWHIGKNATHHISYPFGKPSFCDKYWHKVLYHCESEIEMESTWKVMCEEWNLGDNKWLDNMYRLCHKFESTNSVFQEMACKSMTLSEFVIHYEKQLEKMCNTEIADDYECARGKPYIMVKNSGILQHAVEVYTHVIYLNFQAEFLHVLSEHVLRSETDGQLHIYIVGTESSERKHIMHFCLNDSTISCSCKLFEMQGWLCRHALCVLTNVAKVTNIPSKYILKRWTKVAK
ncbi:hypothetical protein BT93_L2326 [Corymbia citriodora subsp. variegata]|uniref:SWIM-type domain-containing protein n=1 Tax=Corymbia citriodora subsp. variegata TaxID=360336 RepID=A0A8T0CQB9_CORYI|nr:hypothetical protein BT93_L2326 [Corymbia citriodora subsp. variegata]